MRHWNSIVCILEKGEIFGRLLFQDEEGTTHGNDWARGFMRGVRFIGSRNSDLPLLRFHCAG